eukprot:m.185444 g.185444  ORF g.185444 m.185444 type:complete len:554 (-) comp16913_c1_seq3:1548-3209(-)
MTGRLVRHCSIRWIQLFDDNGCLKRNRYLNSEFISRSGMGVEHSHEGPPSSTLLPPSGTTSTIAPDPPRSEPTTQPSSMSTNEDASASDEGVAVLAQVKQCSKQAFRLLTQALDKDQAKAIHRARQLYHEGLSMMQTGLSIDAQGEGPALMEARHLQAKMKENYGQAAARLDVLNELALASVLESTSVKPSAATAAAPARSLSDDPDSIPKFMRDHPPRTRSTPPPGTKPSARPTAKPTSKPDKSTPTINPSNLKNIDHKMAHRILNEIVDNVSDLTMDDVIGLEQAKKALHETIVLPNLRPDLFTGLRKPAKGILLFGPPGNGKTMLAKAVAASANARFFNLSASTLTSKWVGEGEKLVRALFAMARELQPSIIFIDEIDSLLMARSSEEQESSRRMKTEILIQFEGLGTTSEDRVLVMGATNLPHELDTAAIRRFPIRIYVPMPDLRMRARLIGKLLEQVSHALSERDLLAVARHLEGYSASDVAALVREAAMGPIRSLGDRLEHTPAHKVRPVKALDFDAARKVVRPSVPLDTIQELEAFAKDYAYSASA